MTDLQEYIDRAEEALVHVLKEWRPKLMASHGLPNFDLKDDKSVVTELDGSLELAIKDVLRPLSEQVGFMGEEHGQEGSTDIFWLIDPIDGTEQYIRGMSECRSLLCLIVDDNLEYAMAYRFTTDDMFTARRGQGTHRNGERIHLIPRPQERAWIETVYKMDDPSILEAITRVRPTVQSVMYTHEFLNVVEGFIDGWIVYGGSGKVWDYAPRAFLISECGLKVTNIGSETYDYKNLDIIAAHPGVHANLNALLSPQA